MGCLADSLDLLFSLLRPFRKARELSERAGFLYGITVIVLTSVAFYFMSYAINIALFADSAENEDSYTAKLSSVSHISSQSALLTYLLFYLPSVFETFFLSVLVYIMSRLTRGGLGFRRIFGTLAVVLAATYAISFTPIIVCSILDMVLDSILEYLYYAEAALVVARLVYGAREPVIP